MSEASRELANLTERKNLHNPVCGVKEFVCPSVTNFDLNYIRTGWTEWAIKNLGHLWAFVVTSTQNHRIIHFFNIIKILKKFKIYFFFFLIPWGFDLPTLGAVKQTNMTKRPRRPTQNILFLHFHNFFHLNTQQAH